MQQKPGLPSSVGHAHGFARRGREDEEPASPSSCMSCFAGCGIVALLAGVAVVALCVFLFMSQSNALKEADRLYDAGQIADAVKKYKEGYPAAGAEKRRVLARIVKHEIDQGDTEEAKKWIERGLDDNANAVYEGDAARKLRAEVASARLAKKQAEEEEKERRERERARRDGGTKGATVADRITANRNLPRDEFRALVIGRTGSELIGLIGRPDKTVDIDGRVTWYYYRVAKDPASGKLSATVEIIGDNFERVKEVNFY